MTTSNAPENPGKGFGNLQLDSTLTRALGDMNFTNPTPIQKSAIPLALQGRDILGSAQTGTGKTAAFAIPMVQHILTNTQGNALILSPTRELAQQIMKTVAELLAHTRNINTAVLIGGEAMGKQFAQLNRRPRIIVATPGRLNDHLERGSVRLDNTDFLVLDETDRMLDMGFSIQLERIFQYLPEKRQTLMFSATMPHSIMALANQYLDNPERIAIAPTRTIANNLQQDIIRVGDAEKFDTLVSELKACEGTAIVFVKTKYGTERLAKRLANENLETDAIHGDLKQVRREKVIAAFRKGKFRVLVATDVVARGLDVPHVAHVVNYDLPQVAEDYIHRIGRTARAGQSGRALCILTSHDNRKWREIQLLVDPERAKAEEGAPDCVKSRKSKPAFGGKMKKKPFKKSENAGKFGKAEPWSKPTKSAKPAHSENAGKFVKSDKPAKFERGDRPAKFERSDKPAKFDRSDRPAKFDRSERSDRPAKFDRSDRPAKFDRSDRPARFEKGEGQGKSDRPFKAGGKKPFAKKSNFFADKGNAEKSGERNFSENKPARGDKPFKTGGKPNGKPSFFKDKADGDKRGKFAPKGGKKPFAAKGNFRGKSNKVA
ncbi:MAG: DEAD/DEAH box helicase [Pseudobdellovibrionaceae bacterium]